MKGSCSLEGGGSGSLEEGGDQDGDRDSQLHRNVEVGREGDGECVLRPGEGRRLPDLADAQDHLEDAEGRVYPVGVRQVRVHLHLQSRVRQSDSHLYHSQTRRRRRARISQSPVRQSCMRMRKGAYVPQAIDRSASIST